MVTVPVLTTSGSVLVKAGKNVDNYVSGSVLVHLINMAESAVCDATRYNWVDNFGTLSTDVRELAADVCENIAAIYAITYNMSGYTSRIEAEDIINVLRDAALRGISILRDKKTEDFIKEQ